jgi:DNA mismatch repair protein MutS
VEVKEVGEEVLFLHRLVAGGADRSYGIEVGRLAGLPPVVLERARKLLALFEGEEIVSALGGTGKKGSRVSAQGSGDQLTLFGSAPNPLVEDLKKMEPEKMTPIEALALLDRLVSRARQG